MGNRARLAGGAAAAVMLAIIVIALLPRLAGRDAAPVSAGADPASAPQTDAATLATQSPDMTATDTASVAAMSDVPGGPTVDTYLLGPDGIAVIAGQATPGATITLLLDGKPMGEALADASGSFAATAEVMASDSPRSLAFSENGAAPSGDVVLVRPGTGSAAPTAAGAGAVAAAIAASGEAASGTDQAEAATVALGGAVSTTTDMTGADTSATSTDSVEGTDGPATTTTAVTDADPDTTGESDGMTTAEALAAGEETFTEATDLGAAPAASPTIVVDAQGARVLGPGPQVMDRVALDAITYDADGGVQLAGRAPGERTLQVYVDNRPVTTGPVGAKGDWRLTLPDVDPGTYTLRIDELGPDGTVASRVETPFRREAPQDVAALRAGDGAATITTQTVQPGNTLWAIARENFGDGFLYVRVFEANVDQIRDPDLIYPGQVFVIPD